MLVAQVTCDPEFDFGDVRLLFETQINPADHQLILITLAETRASVLLSRSFRIKGRDARLKIRAVVLDIAPVINLLKVGQSKTDIVSKNQRIVVTKVADLEHGFRHTGCTRRKEPGQIENFCPVTGCENFNAIEGIGGAVSPRDRASSYIHTRCPITSSQVKYVVTRTTINLISFQIISKVNRVIACVTKQAVCAMTVPKNIVIRTAGKNVIPRTASQEILTMATGNSVITLTTVDGVVASCADQKVIAPIPKKNVGTIATIDEVIIFTAANMIRRIKTIHNIAARRDRIIQAVVICCVVLIAALRPTLINFGVVAGCLLIWVGAI